jgi:O-antigen/teichoic acid export membrane protein
MSIVKNSSWNLMGYLLPTLIAVPAMGFLARQVGVEKFGLFMIAYVVLGYANIFDVGLSRAMIRAVAIYENQAVTLTKTLSSAICFLWVMGVAISLIFYVSSPYLVSFLKVSSANQSDVLQGFQWLSLSTLPFLLSQVWLAYLEGLEKFKVLNLQKIVSNSLIAGLPVVFVLFIPSFVGLILGLLMARVFTAILAYVCFKFYAPKFQLKFYKLEFIELFRFGGWLAISNIINPIMSYFDRFLLSNLMGAAQVGYYAAASEMVIKLGIFPVSVSRVLFPLLSKSSPADYKKHYQFAKKLTFVGAVCIITPIFIYAPQILTLWMGADFALHATTVLRILLVGLFFSSLLQIPFASVQAQGQSKLTAVIHLYELLPYLGLLYFLSSAFGIEGAAAAWSLRLFFDYVMLSYFARKMTKTC